MLIIRLLVVIFFIVSTVQNTTSVKSKIPQKITQSKPISFKHTKSFTYIGYENIIKLSIFAFVSWLLLIRIAIYLLHHVQYITFNTNLNLLNKHKWPDFDHRTPALIFSLSYLSSFHPNIIFTIFILNHPNLISFIIYLTNKHSLVTIFLSSLTISYILVNLLIINIFLWIYRSTRSIANFIAFLSLSLFRLIILVIAIWVSFLLIILSNDVELHPGDFILNRYFNFCNWNLNSLAKDDFSRLNLLQAHNSTYNYDIISICETSLNDTIELKNNLLDGFKHHFSHHPSGNKHGGVGIFYKDTLPLIIRDDLAFNECIVSELRFGKKKIFHTVMYRSPSDKADSIEFENFVKNFENLHTKLLNENPFAMFFTGDFNAHCLNW